MSSKTTEYHGTASLRTCPGSNIPGQKRLILGTSTDAHTPRQIANLFKNRHHLTIHPTPSAPSYLQADVNDGDDEHNEGSVSQPLPWSQGTIEENCRERLAMAWRKLKSFASSSGQVGEWVSYDVPIESGNDATLRGIGVDCRIWVRSTKGTNECEVKLLGSGDTAITS